MKKTFARSLLAISVVCLSMHAHAATTLRLSHFWPASSAHNQEIFQAWADSIEQASGGELRVQIFPSGTLTKAGSAYKGVVEGISDIAITAQGYTPGRFPLSQLVELPGMVTSAPQGACVLQSLFDEGYLDEEYSDTHPLFMFTTGPGYIHTRDVEANTPDDLQGLRIRSPNDAASLALKELGASPVGIPAPDIYTSMQRGVIDGLSFPWEAMKVFRLDELANHHLEVPLMSVIFVATMNQKSYERLTPEQQAIIDEHSGRKWSEVAGNVYKQLDEQGRAAAEQAGQTINEVKDPMENPDWKAPLQNVVEDYLALLEKRGLNQAHEVYEAALAASKACTSDQK